MAPTSYQGRREHEPGEKKSHSQADLSNLGVDRERTTVANVLEEKGSEVHSVSPETTVRKAAEELCDREIGVLVVLNDDGSVAGIVSERDIVGHLQEHRHEGFEVAVGEIMTRDPVYCSLDDTLRDLKIKMTTGKFRHMPVLDDGKLCGLVSISDVVRFRLLELEYEALKIKQALVG